MWTPKQIAQHTQAAERLGEIKDEAKKFFLEHPTTTEYEAMLFMQDRFRRHHLMMDAHRPIVAFDTNTSHVHYFPEEKTAKTLKKDTLILLDIWGRLTKRGAPYADMTWMFYFGDKATEKFEKLFAGVLMARDKAFRLVKDELKKYRRLPVGADVDACAREYLKTQGWDKYFLHSLGHSLGTRSPHGIYGGLRPRTKSELVPLLGYTIEPGIYVTGEYGFRSEIDFYVDRDGSVIVTTPVQKKIELIRSV